MLDELLIKKIEELIKEGIKIKNSPTGYKIKDLELRYGDFGKRNYLVFKGNNLKKVFKAPTLHHIQKLLCDAHFEQVKKKDELILEETLSELKEYLNS